MQDLNRPLLPNHNKDILPESKVDTGLFFIIIFGVPLVDLFELLIVKPSYNAQWQNVDYIHLIFGLIVSANIYGNLYFLRTVDVTGKRKQLPTTLKVEWKYCHQCQLNSPPRSYHCPKCNECILKRDHHCLFAGSCIGYHNQRYFIWIVFYIWIGSLYANIYHSTFCMSHVFQSGWLMNIMRFFAPHIAWVFGGMSGTSFIIATAQLFLWLVFVVTSYQLFLQFRSLQTGATIYERKQKITIYNLGWKQNIEDSLGHKWYLTWIFPTIPSKQEGNGLHFVKVDEFEELKDI